MKGNHKCIQIQEFLLIKIKFFFSFAGKFSWTLICLENSILTIKKESH